MMEAPRRRTPEKILKELRELNQGPGDPSPVGARLCHCAELGEMWLSVSKAPFASVKALRAEFPGLAAVLDKLSEHSAADQLSALSQELGLD